MLQRWLWYAWTGEQRTRCEVLHYSREHLWLQHAPCQVVVLGDRNKVGPKEHVGDAVDCE